MAQRGRRPWATKKMHRVEPYGETRQTSEGVPQTEAMQPPEQKREGKNAQSRVQQEDCAKGKGGQKELESGDGYTQKEVCELNNRK